MRTENVTLQSGAEVTLAPLTLAQVDAYIEASAAGDRSGIYAACMNSANNGGSTYDLDRFRQEITFPDLVALQTAMRRVTMLAAEGEEAAAK